MTARLIESDIFSGVAAASAGASAIIDLNGAPNLSCQLIYFVTDPVDGAVTFQSSNVGGLDDADWTDLESATSIATDGSHLFTDSEITYRFFRAVKALTSGSIDIQGRVLVTGSGEGGLPVSFFEAEDSGPITNIFGDLTADGPGSVEGTVNSVGGSTAAAIHTSQLLTAAATLLNTANTLVKRGASGEFSAGVITATLVGSASAVGGITITGTPTAGQIPTAVNGTSATWQDAAGGGISALTGDVTASGTGSVVATVAFVGTSSAASVHTSQLLTAAATAANTASTLVIRDNSGNFAAGTISAALTGTASGNTTYTANQYGVVLSGAANAMSVLAPDASTSKVLKSGGASANPSWLAYTDANTVSTIVARDSSGNFSAGTISAALTGTASGNPPNARTISTTAPLTGGGDLSANRTIAMPVATSSVDGYLAATDWVIFAAKASGTLTSAHIYVGNGSNVATDVAVSGDLTLANTGAFTIANSAVTNAKVSASAAIDYSKLATLTSGNILVGSAGNVATSVAMSGDATIIASGALTIANSAITNAKVSASAAIDFSKLAALTSASILIGSAGNVATATAVTGDITITNAGVTAIGANKVTNAMLAQVATATFKGRTTAATGNVEDLTVTQATALLNAMVGDSGSGGTKGLVPAPASGDAAAGKFLKADGTWTAPPGGSATSTPTASTASAWDANVNFSADNFIEGYATTVSSGGTLTLTVDSKRLQAITGTSGHTIVMPDTSTLTIGHTFEVINRMTTGGNNVTVQSNDGTTIGLVVSGGNAGTCGRQVYTCVSTSSNTEAGWTATRWISNPSGTVVSGAVPTWNNTSGLKLLDSGVGFQSSPSAGQIPLWTSDNNLRANNHVNAYATTATAAGTTTLTVASAYYQFFTGATTQTVTLPVASTLPNTGFNFRIVNNSAGTVTVNSSGGNTVATLLTTQTATIVCILTSGTSAASWYAFAA